MARFLNSLYKVRIGAKKGQRRNAFQTGAKIYLSEKNILGLGAIEVGFFSKPVYCLYGGSPPRSREGENI